MFLHSSQWKDFQERAGRTTRAFGDGAFAVQIALPLGMHYWYSPFATQINELVALGAQTGAVFVKCEPMTREQGVATTLLEKGFTPAIKALQPQHTRIVTLGDEARMLSGMHQKTRYNIRVAFKRGVAVSWGGAVVDFTTLMEETTRRDGFHAHPNAYYEELLKTEGVSLVIARVDGSLAAAAIVMEYEGRGIYLHGASSYAHRAAMAPFALHWNVMKTMAGQGITEYDLWGIDEKKWPGVTRFKAGFGGREVLYIGSYDYPLRKIWYTAYQVKNRLR